MSQNEGYKRVEKIDTLGGFPGADRARNLLQVSITDQDVTPSVEIDGDSIGLATDTKLGNTLPREIATWTAGTLAVEQQSPVGIENANGSQINPATEGSLTSTLAREIATWSAGTLLIQEDTPLDVSAATVPIQEATALDVSGAVVPIQEDTPLDVSSRAAREIGKARMQDSGGVLIDPATDEFGHHFGTAVDVNAATETVALDVPGRAETVTIHVETDGAAHVEVRYQDGSGNTVTQRDDTENAEYGVGSAGDIFVEAKVASPQIEVAIVDDSGAANACDYNIYVR